MTELNSDGYTPSVVEFAALYERRTGKRIALEKAKEYLDRLAKYFLTLQEIDREIKLKEKTVSLAGPPT